MAATLTPPLTSPPTASPRKKVTNRRGRDLAQPVRRAVQFGFLLLNIWIGIEFYLFVRFHETGGQTVWAQRPPGVEGWLPIASLMNLKYYLLTGEVPAAHPAGMFLLIAFLSISLLLRKAFCGWLCPIGTLSEYLWKSGRALFGRNYPLPRWADLPMRSLKYILMGLFLYAIGGMSAMAIRVFLDGPYGVVADVKMLNFFRFMGTATAVVVGALLLASVLVQNFWCRYLCPYGALMGLLSWASPARIRRRPDLCIDCAKCARACPSQLKVDQLIRIQSPECIGCMECVTACPVDSALDMTVARRRLPPWAMAAAIAALFLGVTGYAQWSGYWHTNVPTEVYFDLIPRAGEFGHP